MSMEREEAIELFDELAEAGLSVTLVGRVIPRHVPEPGVWNVTVNDTMDGDDLRYLGELADRRKLDLHANMVGGGISFAEHRPKGM